MTQDLAIRNLAEERDDAVAGYALAILPWLASTPAAGDAVDEQLREAVRLGRRLWVLTRDASTADLPTADVAPAWHRDVGDLLAPVPTRLDGPTPKDELL